MTVNDVVHVAIKMNAGKKTMDSRLCPHARKSNVGNQTGSRTWPKPCFCVAMPPRASSQGDEK